MRNAPVDNVVTLPGAARGAKRCGSRQAKSGASTFPIDPSRGAALVTFQVTSGFRPNEADPASRDTRFLGAFVKLE